VNIPSDTTCFFMRQDETEPEVVSAGLKRRIIRTGKLMTVVIDFTSGPWEKPDPFHSHPHEQITYVAAGELLFCSEGQEPERLKTGDLIAIPPNKPHSVQILSEHCRLIDSFHPIREDFLK